MIFSEQNYQDFPKLPQLESLKERLTHFFSKENRPARKMSTFFELFPSLVTPTKIGFEITLSLHSFFSRLKRKGLSNILLGFEMSARKRSRFLLARDFWSFFYLNDYVRLILSLYVPLINLELSSSL